VQSHARTEATELQHTRDSKEELELVLKKVKLKTKDEKITQIGSSREWLQAYDRIPNSAQITEPTTTQNIDHIVQTIDQYMKEIENLLEQLIPTTPSEVKEQRRQEVVGQMEEME
jgi:hypothetical protein